MAASCSSSSCCGSSASAQAISNGVNLSFINFSAPAADSISMLKIYEKIQDRIPHDYVLYGLHANDLIAFPTSYVISNSHRLGIKIRKYSKAIGFMLSKVEKIISRHENTQKLLSPSNFDRPFFINNMNAINQINGEARKRGAKLLVVILPILIDLREGSFKPLYDKIKNILSKNEIEFFDLSNSISSFSDSTLWILPFDQHPNELANRIYAEELGKRLIYIMKDLNRLKKLSIFLRICGFRKL